jgi:toxin YoeB
MTRREARFIGGRTEERLLVVSTDFVKDLGYGIEQDRAAASRLIRLLLEIEREPFTGIGKPEPLKHNLRGYWSRRITDEDRLLYSVDKDYIEFVSARFHYL